MLSEIGTARKNFLAALGPVPLRLQSANCHGDEKALLQCGYQEAASGACNQGIAAAECVPPAGKSPGKGAGTPIPQCQVSQFTVLPPGYKISAAKVAGMDKMAQAWLGLLTAVKMDPSFQLRISHALPALSTQRGGMWGEKEAAPLLPQSVPKQ